MKIILFLIFLFMIYGVIPNHYYKYISRKVIRKMDAKQKQIALTFDDGPDPRYTHELLDLLKDYNIQATFFLVAEKSLKNRDILERIIHEGHSIGLHSLSHKHAWLSMPFETKKDFEKSMKIFKELKVNLKFFRPPWGTFNILTQYFAKKLGLETILWSINGRDWSSQVTSKEIAKRIMNYIQDGDIILLHDSGGAEGAPKRTLEALKEIIPKLKNDGYKFVTIDEKVGDLEHEKAIQTY
ncbi:polysaccharide deacetylase family protein [Crassaminicella profunda]|uniref:polysaccharide deacetylase family protein n=1 Tax=Crassaminicella profunda TaxID=1286698 RepID=UPI001CA78B04|nr:polysaccharide deacetylase family protein [Crassaminicella profunda]QZY56390.1 polysaccharide deacetylase family protein [Crassaminicella profunda]